MKNFHRIAAIAALSLLMFSTLLAAQSQEEMMQILMERSKQYIEAPTPEAKMEVAAQTALEFPNFAMAMRDILGAYVENAVDKLGRVEEAYTFLSEQYAPLVTDPEVKQLLEVALLNVYGREGYGPQFLQQLKQSTMLADISTNDLVRVHGWAQSVQNVEAITTVNSLLKARATPEAVTAEYADRGYSADVVEGIIQRRGHRIAMAEALTTALSGDATAALKQLDQLKANERLDGFGKPSVEYLTLKADMLAMAGKHDEAAKVYAWLVDYRGEFTLKDKLKQAWKQGSNSDLAFDDFNAEITASIMPSLPEMKAATASGEIKNVNNMRGKVTLVTLWSTTCAKCRVELPVMNGIYAKYKDKGFDMIAIEGNRDLPGTEQFINEHNLSFPVLFDLEGRDSIAFNLQIDSIPVNYLVDEDGRIVKVHIGYSSGDEVMMEAAIRKHLGLDD